MKKTLYNTIIFLFIGYSFAIAQNINSQRQTELFARNAYKYDTSTIYDPANPENYKGTPYHSDNFLTGNVYIENELILSNVALRYNAIADEIEFKESLNSNDKEVKALVKSKEIYAKIMKDIFVFIPSEGYYLVVFDGDNFSLLKKVTKKYFPAKKAKNNYERSTLAEFEDRFSYSIYTRNGEMMEFPKSKSKKLKVFGNSEKLIKDYIKKYNLDLNKEKDLKKVIIYLDGAEGASL
jgi:hypothetical protein|tara:strand:- start:802 stop:1512 length:711 start_codon:yes stop_codon:yes gene_type:complete